MSLVYCDYNTINGLPLNVCCDSTGQFVAYATTIYNTNYDPSNSSTGNQYYYGSTYYSTNYGKTFNMVNMNPSASYQNQITSVSLSVLSNSNTAYILQSFTYIDITNNIPLTSLYYFEMTSDSATPTIVNVNLNDSSSSSSLNIPAFELPNILITSITNNGFMDNGQSFLFIFTEVNRNSNNENSPYNQFICQFNPFAGNSGNSNYAYNNYYNSSYGYALVINTGLTTTQCTINLNSTGTSIYGICYTGVGNNLKNYENSIFYLQGITIYNVDGYNYLNFTDSNLYNPPYNIIPTISNTDPSNIPMYNISVNSNSLLLSNNINNDLNYTPSNIWVYGLNDFTTSPNVITYSKNNYGSINGILSSSIQNNIVYSPISNTVNESGYIYCVDFSSNSTKNNFSNVIIDNSFNYWLSSCTSYSGDYYYLSSLSDTSKYTGSLYCFSNNFPYNTSTGYTLYPDISANYNTSDDISYNNFLMPIDPSTNQPFLYFNVLLLGCGGIGNYQSGDTSSGGGGGGVIQAINIPFSPDNGIYITNLSITATNGGSGISTQVVFTYSNSEGNISLIGGIGGNGDPSNTGGAGGVGSYTQTLSTDYWNGKNNTCSANGGNGRGNGSTGEEGATVTQNGITVTGSPGGSGKGGNANNSGNIKVPLYNGKTYKYQAQGGAQGSDTITYPYNGGGGPGANNQYSKGGAYGFVLLWLSS